MSTIAPNGSALAGAPDAAAAKDEHRKHYKKDGEGRQSGHADKRALEIGSGVGRLTR